MFPDFHLLHRAAQRADQLFSSRHADVTPRQFLILVAVETKAGMSQTELTQLTGIDRSTLSDSIGRLVKRKYLLRRRGRADARAYAVALTPAGHDALLAARKAAAATDDALFAPLKGAQRAQLSVMLDAIVNAGTGRQFG